jgi:hypothetical protein
MANIIHSKKSEGSWFRETADATARKYVGGQAGKGSKPRTNINSKNWQNNYDEINWGAPKKKDKTNEQ